MKNLPNFKIKPLGEISKEFLKNGIGDFNGATHFVANLDYGRNVNKDDLKTVFTDNCGTCSAKHALLKVLADENGFSEIKLFLGIFKMNSINTPKVSQTLKNNNLEFIPEAHNYLKLENQIFDFTRPNAKASDFEDDLLLEIEMKPSQISDYKVEFHKNYLKDWIESKKTEFNLEKIWKIREQCIRDLANPTAQTITQK